MGRFDKKEMFDAVCDDCGKDCKVPFQPTSGKPIYCSRCFDKHDNRGGDRGGSRGSFRGRGRDRDDSRRRGSDRGGRSNDRRRTRDVRRSEMFHAVCDTCGKDCELPFRPTGEKPVYCDDCFGKKNSQPDPVVLELQEKMKSVDAKLDMIINALKPLMPSISEDGDVEFKERKVVRADDKAEGISLK